MSGIERIFRDWTRPPPVPPVVVTPPPDAPPVLVTPGDPIRIPGAFRPRMYSYWPATWANPQDGATYFFGGLVGAGPRFYRIVDRTVQELGPLVRLGGETEGWYWDQRGHVYAPDGPRLVRFNPFDGTEHVAMDASSFGYMLEQAHSSEDGQVHSATVKNSSWEKTGTLFTYRGVLLWYAAEGELDESIVTKCGEYGLIQESHNNRVVTLRTGEVARIPDDQRAVAHCDTGHGCVIGEADKPDPGACVRWDFEPWTMRILFETLNMGHISIQAGRCLHSNAQELRLLDMETGAVQWSMPHGAIMPPPGASSDDRYNGQVRANLSPCGKRVCYRANDGVYVVAV